jgi:hypothetical protein
MTKNSELLTHNSLAGVDKLKICSRIKTNDIKVKKMETKFCHYFWHKVPNDTNCACTTCHGEQYCDKGLSTAPNCMRRAPEWRTEQQTCERCKQIVAQMSGQNQR